MNDTSVKLSAERRALLATKGRILYGKFCGTGGRGICAESFALHQLRLGNTETVRDLIDFLESQVEALKLDDPEGLAAPTAGLLMRLREHLENEIDT